MMHKSYKQSCMLEQDKKPPWLDLEGGYIGKIYYLGVNITGKLQINIKGDSYHKPGNNPLPGHMNYYYQ